jgi:hypothetical protein
MEFQVRVWGVAKKFSTADKRRFSEFVWIEAPARLKIPTHRRFSAFIGG